MILATLPYVIGLAIAAALFIHMGHIDYTPRPGQLGPETWPRLAIGLMAAACVFEIARTVLHGKTSDEAAAGAFATTGEMTGDEPTFPLLLVGGILLVTLYAVLVSVLGFPLTTFLFLAAFIYLGRYRRHGVIWAFSAIMTILMSILFLRIAYVSLPRGIPPFDRITDLFLMIPGV